MLSGRAADANLASLGDVIADSSALDLSAQIDAVVQDQVAAVGRLAHAVKVGPSGGSRYLSQSRSKFQECPCLAQTWLLLLHRSQWITMVAWIF